MSETNGWPGKPGVPLNPKKSRYHWVVFPKTKHWPQGKIQIGRWRAEEETWEEISDCSLSLADLANWRYLRPCPTPAEEDARIATARKDVLEEAARWHDEQAVWMIKGRRLAKAEEHRKHAAAIRARAKGEGQ